MCQLETDLSSIAMSVLAEPEVKVAPFLSLDHKDNIRILLDASTVPQILKLGRSSFLDVISVQLTEQDHRAVAILIINTLYKRKPTHADSKIAL